MRIGCLQFAPVKGDVNNNLSRADAVLLKESPEDLDLLVLPELAFTGYYFKSLQEIFPHLEPPGSGTTSLWARTVALKYDCTVVAGYPEKVDVSHKWPASPEYYNSAIIVDGEGQTVGEYRKNHLYCIDETWALEGQGGFYTGEITGVKNAILGISMDLTPYRFQAPWDSFEFARRVLQVRSNLVIVSLAWPTNQEGRLFSRTPQEPDMETLMHWISRLEPIIQKESDEEVIIVFCNRTGSEDGVVYAGSSAVLGIKGGEVSVYGILGRSDRELLVVDTDKEPYGKLIYRPENDTVSSGPSQPFYNSTSGQPPKTPGAVPPPPPPPPVPQKVSRGRPEAVSALSGSSISEVLSTNRQAETPGTGGVSIRNQPKLSLKTSPDELEPPFPSVPTPTGPSPTPFSRRPRISIPPAQSSTQRYFDTHMKSPTFHPMQINPPPVQILGGEVAILQSPLYSGVDWPGSHPWDVANINNDESSPNHSETTNFTGLSSPKGPSALTPFPKFDSQSGSNAAARRQQVSHPTETMVARPDPKASGSPRAYRSSVSRRILDSSPVTEGGPSNVVSSLERVALEQQQPLAPDQLPPMAYTASPRDPTPASVKRVRSPGFQETPSKERRSNAAGSSGPGIRDQSRGRSTGPHHAAAKSSNRTATPAKKNREQSRGRSRTHRLNTGGVFPASQLLVEQERRPTPPETNQVSGPPSRTMIRSTPAGPINLINPQQSVVQQPPRPSSRRKASRSTSAGPIDHSHPPAIEAHHEPRPSSIRKVSRSTSAEPIHFSKFPASEVHQAPRPLLRKKISRSTSAEPIDLSQFRLIEERPSESCAIHGTRARSSSQNQIMRRTSVSPSTHNRSSSARRQRIMRHTPIKSNLRASNMDNTPPSKRSLETQLHPGICNPSPIEPLEPLPPLDREDPPASLTPPAIETMPPAVPQLDFGSTVFHFSWNQERKSWVESWLPTISVSDLASTSVSPHLSPKTLNADPVTPRAMVTACETRGAAGNDALSFVRTLESMVKAPELTRAW